MILTKDIDYRIQGYHKKTTFDSNGDISTVEYFKDYDSSTDTFTNLKVKETRTYTRNATTGLLEKRDMTIEWIKSDGVTVADTKTTVKHYDSQNGYASNKQARENLINKASMYLFSAVGETDSKAFLRQVKADVAGYKGGDIQPLLDAVSNSTEAYMTGTVKATLDAILNIQY